MAIFSLAQRTSATAAASADQEIIAGANNAFRVLEYGFTQNAATAGVFGLGTPAANGITPTSPVTGLAEDQGDTTTGATTSALAWGTGPTVPANFFRRISCAATIGVGTIWTFPRGLKKLKGPPAAGTLVLWIIATAPVLDTWWVVDE